MDPLLHQVELDITHRTDDVLAARFDSFANVECAPSGSGESSNSPAYAMLSRHVARSGALLALARECRGAMPQIPARFPKVAYRVGIDLSPIDLGQDDAYRWLQALIWPEHADRLARLAAARSVWLQEPPRVEAGDAMVLLPELIEQAPESAALCIVHAHTLNQFSDRARAAFVCLLQSVSQSRPVPVYEVSAEHDRLTLFRYAACERMILLSAARSAHGRWVEW